jgi:CRISPR-associated exonuclease Cas4
VNATTEPFFLEVTDLKQWTYCARVVWYRYCLPAIRPVTYSMEAGTREHADAAALEQRRSLHAYGLETGERSFDVALRSERLGISGRVDMVIRVPGTQGDEAVVVDYKLTEGKAGNHVAIQVAAYALLIEEAWGIPVRKGFIYHLGQRRAEAIALTPALRRKVIEATEELHRFILSERMPNPPKSLAPCVACEFRRFCNDVI